MTVSYHPSAQDDVNEILDYYRKVGGELLADRFVFPPISAEHRFADFDSLVFPTSLCSAF
jgi:hypothetical protein